MPPLQHIYMPSVRCVLTRHTHTQVSVYYTNKKRLSDEEIALFARRCRSLTVYQSRPDLPNLVNSEIQGFRESSSAKSPSERRGSRGAVGPSDNVKKMEKSARGAMRAITRRARSPTNELSMSEEESESWCALY